MLDRGLLSHDFILTIRNGRERLFWYFDSFLKLCVMKNQILEYTYVSFFLLKIIFVVISIMTQNLT